MYVSMYLIHESYSFLKLVFFSYPLLEHIPIYEDNLLKVTRILIC